MNCNFEHRHMVETMDIGLVAAVVPLEHLELVERLVLVAMADVRAQNSSFEVQHQPKQQLIEVVLPAVNIQMLDQTVVV